MAVRPRAPRAASPLAAGALAVLMAGGCSDGGDASAPPAERDPVMSEVLVRAVDAGTGDGVADSALTVRYLVRTPITLDASAVEEVEAGDTYRIAHPVSSESLVVEVRLEAPSYRRLDTVVSVPRGGSTGPLAIPLAFRTDRVATREPGRTGTAPSASPSGSEASPPARSEPLPAREEPPPTRAEPAPVDRRPLEDGDRFFRNGDWGRAAAAYAQMPAPPTRQGEYARDYVMGQVRRGIAHINLGQLQRAEAALGEAASFDFREYSAYFYLGQVQCALGRFDEGRRSLQEVERLAQYISQGQGPVVLALTDYQRGMCSYRQFRQAGTPQAMVETGRRALQEFQDFARAAARMNPAPPEIRAAQTDARQRAQEIQGRLR